jgi:hypothetical protein
MINSFEELPFPSPGDRIKANDFICLSQSLRVIYDMFMLSSALFGHDFGVAKLALASQQYVVQKVMSVFGTEIGNMNDKSLDDRKVIQVMPIELGERGVCVVVTEVVETRRLTPNLIGKTYTNALNELRSILADVTFPATSATAPDLRGRPLKDAREDILAIQ